MSKSHKNEGDYAFFLGCIAPLRYPGIEASTRLVMEKLGVALHDMVGASCCPAPGLIRRLSEKTWLTLGARNLCLAEEMGYDIVTICNGCLLTLSEVNNRLKSDPNTMKDVNSILSTVGMSFEGSVEVRHFIDVLYENVGVERIKDEIDIPLGGLRAAPFYGCHYFTVHCIKDSNTLEELIQATGARAVERPEKTLCCGAGEGIKSGSNVLSIDIARALMGNISASNVDCVVDICPFCHLQLDLGQVQIREKFGEVYDIPVLHYSQLLGLAFGTSTDKLGLNAQAVTIKNLISNLNITFS